MVGSDWGDRFSWSCLRETFEEELGTPERAILFGAIEDRRGRGMNVAGLANEEGAGLAILISSHSYRNSDGLPMLVRFFSGQGIACLAGVASAW